MSNDMKLIMEEWRRSISEIGLQDVGLGSYDPVRIDRPAPPASTPFWVLLGRVLDPTGISSWEDLADSWRRYTTNLDLDDPDFWGDFGRFLEVSLNLVDSIPVVAFFAKGATVPAKAASSLIKTGRFIQKSADKAPRNMKSKFLDIGQKFVKSGNKIKDAPVPDKTKIQKARELINAPSAKAKEKLGFPSKANVNIKSSDLALENKD